MNWHWPQYVLAGIMCVEFGFQFAMHGKPRQDYNAFVGIAAAGTIVALLYFGGFWS